MSTLLLWVDFETSGLDLQHDEILEAAFILTDSDLNELRRWESTFQPSPTGWARLMANDFVRKMHCANGLVSEIVNEWGRPIAPPVHALAAGIAAEIRARIKTGDVVHLAGSGVAAFDRPLIRRDMDVIEALLHYAPIDVGVLKRTWKLWSGYDISDDNDNKTHRAMADVEGHLHEARLFRDQFRLAVQP